MIRSVHWSMLVPVSTLVSCFEMCSFCSQETVSSSSSEELCFIMERKSRRSSKRRCLAAGRRKGNVDLTPVSPEENIFVSSPSVSTSPQESYLSAASSSSSSVVELEAQVVDSPVAIPSAANCSSPEADRRRRWESLTMSAASSASLFSASLQADFLFSLADLEMRQLCGGHEEDLAGEEEHLCYSNPSLYCIYSAVIWI